MRRTTIEAEVPLMSAREVFLPVPALV